MSLFKNGVVFILSIVMLEVSRTRASVPVYYSDESKTKLTWSFSDGSFTRVDIKEAIDFWATRSRFTFEEVSKYVPANIQVYSLPYDSTMNSLLKLNTGIVAYTYYIPSEGQLPNGTVNIAGYEEWPFHDEQNERALNLRRVLKHQLGYILGQQDSADFASIMTPDYSIVNLMNSTENNEWVTIAERYKIPQNICRPKFDTTVVYKDNLFAFLGKYIYVKSKNKFFLVRDRCPQLPENLTKINAFYADPRGFQLFFIGKQIYFFEGSHLMADYPKDLTDWLGNASVDHVDGLVTDSSGIYVVSDAKYWKFDRLSNGSYMLAHPSGWPKLVDGKYRSDFNETFIAIEGKPYPLHPFKNTLETEAMFAWHDIVCQTSQGKFMLPACCNV